MAGLHASAALVAGPEVVAKTLDDVVRGDPHVGGAALEQRDCPLYHRPDSGLRTGAQRLGEPVVLTEELVRAIDQVNPHKNGFSPPVGLAGVRWREAWSALPPLALLD